MTRAEEIRVAALDICSQSIKASLAFKKGAEWADANPKLKWIDAGKDLPCNHKDLIESTGPFSGIQTKPVLALRVDGEYVVCCMFDTYDTNEWLWSSDTPILYWHQVPGLPKEE